MREIIFRGKRVDNGEWVEGFYISHLNACHYIIPFRTGGYEAMDNSFYVHKWFEADPSTIGQYTGLKDKNGKMIFEGDIIAVPFEEDRSPWEENCIYYENGKVYFDEIHFGWYVKFKGDELSLWEYDDCGVSIIGNIHDNPELIKEEAQP